MPDPTDIPGTPPEPAPFIRTEPTILPGSLPSKLRHAGPTEPLRPRQEAAVPEQPAEPEVPPPGAIRMLTPEAEKLNGQLRSTRGKNQKFLAMMESMGVAVSGADLINLRINTLLGILWPMDTRRGQLQRLDFENEYEQQLAAMLEPMMSQLRQAILGQGGNLPPEMIAQLAAQSGMAVPEALRHLDG
jgi:hypothetical protein